MFTLRQPINIDSIIGINISRLYTQSNIVYMYLIIIYKYYILTISILIK